MYNCKSRYVYVGSLQMLLEIGLLKKKTNKQKKKERKKEKRKEKKSKLHYVWAIPDYTS